MVRFLLALLILIGSAKAEVYNFGVEKTVDEFTAVESCFHLVIHTLSDHTGIAMNSFSDVKDTYVYIMSHVEELGENAFNMFGVLSDDLIYVRFPDGEVLQLEPEHVEVQVEFMESGYEVAGFASTSLANRIMSSPGDIRVRFDGSSNTVDFTISHEVITTLAEGFGQECQ